MRSTAPLVAMLFVVSSQDAAAARLPTGVKPSHYKIHLAPDLVAGTFTGDEIIDVELAKPSSTITLHAVDLEILQASAGPAGKLVAGTSKADAKAETISLTFPSTLPAGKAQIALTFRGKLDDRLRGLYLAKVDGKRYALTQFEGTDARRAFPCFDEPAYKARFQLTLDVPKGMPAISNTAITKRLPTAGTTSDRVEFAETLPMSSYLVAIAMGPFASRTRVAGKTPITVWAAEGKEQLGDYALKEAAAMLPRLEAWFGIPYPYGKLDLIAAPEFAFGGMENVGAILFKSGALLIDEKSATPRARRMVSEVVAHEIAHQWFGDLVTMAWWDDIWLNESFATWMEKKVMSELHPDWKMWRDFAVDKMDPMAVDELADAHPIRSQLFTEDEEPESSPEIIYGKGAAVLRMVETWLGEDRFRKGVQTYLSDHKYGNTIAADFFGALANASGQPVGSMAEKWIGQSGHPLVTLTARCEGNKTRLTFEQERMFGDGRGRGETMWPIPVCVRYATGAAGKEHSQEHTKDICVMLLGERQSVDLESTDNTCANYVVGNSGAAGFFRVLYDEASLGALLKRAEQVLSPEERVSLLDDQLALAAAGKAPMRSWLDVVAALAGERDRAVLHELGRQLALLDRHLVGAADQAGFVALVESIFGEPLKQLGMATRPGDDEDARRTRALAIMALGGGARRADVVARAKSEVASWLKEKAGSASSSFDGPLAEAWIQVAAMNGDKALFDQLLERFKADRTPEERDRVLDALARFERPELLDRLFEFALTDAVRTEEAGRPLRIAFSTRAGHEPAANFVAKHAGRLISRLPPNGQIRLIHDHGNLCGEAEAKRVAALFEAHPVPRMKLALALSVESIRVCSALRERGQAALSGALQQKKK